MGTMIFVGIILWAAFYEAPKRKPIKEGKNNGEVIKSSNTNGELNT